MINHDYWKLFVGEDSPETFMRNFGAADPELCVTRFLEDRGHLYGVVNQGTWQDTFSADAQYHRSTVRVYLLSYLEETRGEWGPALEAKPPSIPRRYREKFDQEKYPPPASATTGNQSTLSESDLDEVVDIEAVGPEHSEACTEDEASYLAESYSELEEDLYALGTAERPDYESDGAEETDELATGAVEPISDEDAVSDAEIAASGEAAEHQ